jgi:hypothetical protein
MLLQKIDTTERKMFYIADIALESISDVEF